VDPDQRCAPQLAGPAAGGGQDDALGTVELEAVRSVGGEVALDVVGDEVDGAGLVGVVRHAPRVGPGITP
jgi:hypothetical protein